MAIVIELLGGECTGKTRLANELADALQAVVVTEELRDFVDQHARTPQRGEQAGVMQRQADRLQAAIRAADSDQLIVCDPSPLMTAVYSVQYFDDYTLLERALGVGAPPRLLVRCHPDVPWTSDGLHRDGPKARQRSHEILSQSVLPAMPDGRVLEVSGPAEQRVDAVRRALSL